MCWQLFFEFVCFFLFDSRSCFSVDLSQRKYQNRFVASRVVQLLFLNSQKKTKKLPFSVKRPHIFMALQFDSVRLHPGDSVIGAIKTN